MKSIIKAMKFYKAADLDITMLLIFILIWIIPIYEYLMSR